MYKLANTSGPLPIQSKTQQHKSGRPAMQCSAKRQYPPAPAPNQKKKREQNNKTSERTVHRILQITHHSPTTARTSRLSPETASQAEVSISAFVYSDRQLISIAYPTRTEEYLPLFHNLAVLLPTRHTRRPLARPMPHKRRNLRQMP